MLRFGLPSVISGIPRMFNLRLDQMLMAALLPPHTLGLYVVAVTWSQAVNLFPSALGNVLFPRTAAQAVAEDRHRVFAKGIRVAVLSTVCAAALVLVATPWAIPLLFGPAFGAGKSPPGSVECEVGAGPPTQPGQRQPPLVPRAGGDRGRVRSAVRRPTVPPGRGDRANGYAQGHDSGDSAGARSPGGTLAHRRRSLPTDPQLTVS